mmetsp:Transcript_84930/g.262937  ORF Transcript_84930/g.262937 Transcript_84930/m.262937 type:complete len:394 (+) Transcript_84930:64-1245(+)
MSRLTIFSALAAIASPVVIARVYQARRRRSAEEELEEALESGDASRLSLACSRAEDAGLDAARVEEARREVRKLRAVEELRRALGGGDAKRILRMRSGAKQLGVDEPVLSEARAEAQRLLKVELESPDVMRIIAACACAPEAQLESTAVTQGLARARQLAETELREALDGADAGGAAGAKAAAAARIGLACQRAEAAAARAPLVSEGRKAALRLRAEAELQEAVGSGHAERVEEACLRAEEAHANPEVIAEARAGGLRLRAEAELLAALESGSARRIEVACFRAEKAGVDAAAAARGRAELARVKERNRERREQAEAELLAAMRAQAEGPERLYKACRRAEEAGVDEERTTEGRGEARRRFDLMELRAAMKDGDMKRAFVASGGSMEAFPLER